eukprot:SAG25_NODE_1378_length_3165_cov_8.165036_2_plen_57_part_00
MLTLQHPQPCRRILNLPVGVPLCVTGSVSALIATLWILKLNGARVLLRDDDNRTTA